MTDARTSSNTHATRSPLGMAVNQLRIATAVPYGQRSPFLIDLSDHRRQASHATESALIPGCPGHHRLTHFS